MIRGEYGQGPRLQAEWRKRPIVIYPETVDFANIFRKLSLHKTNGHTRRIGTQLAISGVW